MLTIALLGASPTETSRLARDLERSAAACGWPVVIVAQSGAPVLPPAAKPGFDLVLLAGMETALAPMPLQAISRADAQQRNHLASSAGASAVSRAAVQEAQEAADAAIRAALAEAGMAYRVLYGNSSERLAQACEAIASLLPRSEPPAQTQTHASQASRKPTPWVWLCDKCSDPQCEHRLLTALLAQRAGSGQAGDD